MELRKKSFLPFVSLNLAQQDLEGLTFKKGSYIDYGTKIDTIKRNMDNVSRVGYRCEMSTRGRYLSTVYNIMAAVARESEWLCFDYQRFKFIFLHNLYYMNSLIGGNTITDLFNNISAEMSLKEAYLKGSVNKHFLPQTYNIKKFYSNTGIRRLNASFKTAIAIESNSGVAMMRKLLKYDSLKCLKEGFTDLLKSFLFVMETNSPEVCIKRVIMQYNDDYTRYYKIKDNIILNFNNLGPLIFFLSSIYLGDIAMLPYIYLLGFIKKTFNMSDDVLMDKLYTIWRTHGINVAWVHINNPEVDSKLLILLNLDVISIGGHNKEIWVEKLRSHTLMYQAQQGLASLRPKRVKWTECEHIRLLNDEHSLVI